MYNKSRVAVWLLVSALCVFYLSASAIAELDSQVLDDKLTKITTYDYGQSRITLTEITDIVRAAYDHPQDLKVIEKHFLEFLRSDATLASKQFICRKLSIIGTQESVPTLAPMLTDETTSDMARYALERIPGDAVNEALRQALPKTKCKIKVGIIASLGVRRDCKSVPALQDLIGDSDSVVAAAAVGALGQITGSEATKALADAKDKTTGKLRQLVLDAYLRCADNLLAHGQVSQASAIYEQLYDEGEPEPIRFAALRGMVKAKLKDAEDIIVDVLKSDDEPMQAVAISLIREIPGEKIVKAAATEMPLLSVAPRVQLLSALGERGDKAALSAVNRATSSHEVDVRIAAFKALGSLGEAPAVNLLAQTAADTEGAEQEAARQSLYRLSGPEIDETILSSIPRAEPKVKVELIRSIGQRYIQGGVKILLRTARDSNKNVRVESYKVLGKIADEKCLPKLVDLLVKKQSEAERNEAEKTVVAVSNKIPEENRRAGAVLAKLPSVKDATVKCSLMSVLSKIGDSSALPVLRSALDDRNVEVKSAAIRALSEWPDAEPLDDLLEVARSSEDEKHRVLALRGYIRLVGLASDRTAVEKIGMYKQAMDLTSNVDVRKRVLSGLANVKDMEALNMAAAYLEDQDLKQEAEAAVIKIAEGTLKEIRTVVKKVAETTENESLRTQAEKLIKDNK